MNDMTETIRFLDTCCRCSGSPADAVSATDLVAALTAWRLAEKLPPWSFRTCALRLRDAAEQWRDPATGYRPHRQKTSSIRYVGMTLKA